MNNFCAIYGYNLWVLQFINNAKKQYYLFNLIFLPFTTICNHKMTIWHQCTVTTNFLTPVANLSNNSPVIASFPTSAPAQTPPSIPSVSMLAPALSTCDGSCSGRGAAPRTAVPGGHYAPRSPH